MYERTNFYLLDFNASQASTSATKVGIEMRHEVAQPSGPRVFPKYRLTHLYTWAGSLKVDLENYGCESIINFKETSFQTLQQQLQSCEVLVMLVTHG